MDELERELGEFYGTQGYWRHLSGVIYTDGVQFLAQRAGAYWLIDMIAEYQYDRVVSREEFQVWRLDVSGRSAVLTCTDGGKGSGVVTLVRRAIEYTDFPLRSIVLYAELGSLDGEKICRVLLLPSEH